MARFLPHVTVATVVAKDGKFLLVKESPNGALVYNQPAGHLEAGESLADAAVRECREETGWDVELTGFLGVTLFYSAKNQVTYVRNTFVAEACRHHPEQALDDGIIGIDWLTHEQVKAAQHRLRSPLVLKAIEQYLNGPILPLTTVASFGLDNGD